MATLFMRRRLQPSLLSPLLVSGLFVVMVVTLFHSLTLTPRQVAERDFGRFDYSTTYAGIDIRPGQGGLTTALPRELGVRGVEDVAVTLTALDGGMLPGGSADDDVRITEAAWAARPFGGRYTLTQGRWPKSPGEVVVVSPPSELRAVDRRLSLLSGRVMLQVVGVADDRYYSEPEVLSAPGTWGALDPRLLDDFPAFSATASLYWSGASPRRVLPAFSAALARYSPLREQAITKRLVDSTSSRQESVADEPRYGLSDIPLVYSVPAIFLPILSVLLMIGLDSRWTRRTMRLLVQTGVTGWSATFAVFGYHVIRALVALVLGSCLGFGGGIIVGQLIAHYGDVLVSTPQFPMTTVARILVVALPVLGLAAFLHRRSVASSPEPPSTVPPREDATPDGYRLTWARHVLAAVAGGVAIFAVTRIDDSADAMMMAGAVAAVVLLTIPESVGVALRFMPAQGPRMTLAKRRMVHDRLRVYVGVALVAAVVGAAGGFVTLLDSIIRSSEASTHAKVLPGQLMVAHAGSTMVPPPQKVLEAVEKGTQTTLTPITLHQTLKGDEKVTVLEGGFAPLLAIDSVGEVERLIDRSLEHEEVRTLERGGALVWESETYPGGAPASSALVRFDGSRTRQIPLLEVQVPAAGWRDGREGLILTSTARDLGVPTSAGAVVFAPLSPRQVSSALQTVRNRGLNLASALTYTEPEPPIPPRTLRLSAGLLGGLVAGVLLLLSRAQASSLRSYAAQLVVIGLSPRWARMVLLLQLAGTLSLGLMLGGVIAVVPVVAFKLLEPALLISVPWLEILTLLTGLGLACVVTTWLSIRSFTLAASRQ
jgi:hypothetical protein